MAETSLFVEERKMKIVEFIERHQKATVAELCGHFGMSSATIRNDLRDLEAAKLIIRTHGGAMVKTKTGLELTAVQREDQHIDAKRRIARVALDMIEDGDTIILDTGTTTLEIARLLGERRDVTVVTNDLQIATILENLTETTVVFMGGIVRRKFHCTVFTGDARAQVMSGLVVDKAFMGTNGLSLKRGATTPDIGMAQTKKLMISMASSVVVVCDVSKLGRDSFAQFASLEQMHTVILDSCRAADKDQLERLGIDVVLCAE
jgi:DeoR family fructose operon transcriptional repressor